ncbi:MAG: type II toxin-antitoxin system RelE/ParE family toxin [Deltaproteobacteria bacterium]|nr:type II toxin-antitoxin system RelE/ParE family toxin [Deltaproteobacteria bacterium]
MKRFEIVHFITEDGKDLFQDWLDRIRDNKARAAIIMRVIRLEAGNPGDHKSLRDGILELRIDVGAGYRVYYARMGEKLILLTCGGHKKSQSRDIKKAVELLKNWEKRHGEDPSFSRGRHH